MLKHGIHGITMESVLSEQGRSMVNMVYHEYLAFHGMEKAWKSMVDLGYIAFLGVGHPWKLGNAPEPYNLSFHRDCTEGQQLNHFKTCKIASSGYQRRTERVLFHC
jgi:hypothetical protein